MLSKKKPPKRNKICIIDILLTHWGRVTHIRVGNLTIIGSNNSLSPSRRQAIIWSNAGILDLRKKLQWNFNLNACIWFKTIHLKYVECTYLSEYACHVWLPWQQDITATNIHIGVVYFQLILPPSCLSTLCATTSNNVIWLSLFE